MSDLTSENRDAEKLNIDFDLSAVPEDDTEEADIEDLKRKLEAAVSLQTRPERTAGPAAEGSAPEESLAAGSGPASPPRESFFAKTPAHAHSEEPEDAAADEGPEEYILEDRDMEVWPGEDEEDDSPGIGERMRSFLAILKRIGVGIASGVKAVYRRIRESREASKKRKKAGGPKEVSAVQVYKEKLVSYHLRKWFSRILVIAIVLAAALICIFVVCGWKYTSFHKTLVSENEDTISFNYCNVDEYILKYGIDHASLVDRTNRTIWTVSYSMNSPAVTTCGSTMAIYDRKGTNICICDEKGQIGYISANLPIVRAKVAEQGVVAAILDDGSNAVIQYYDTTGSLISSIRTTMDAPGYPMDIALSRDGLLMAVSYIHFSGTVPGTRLYYYNFGSVGQNQMDNQVSAFVYDDMIIPELIYLKGDVCASFLENGFALYAGSQIPELRTSVTFKEEIISVFHDDSRIGFILRNQSGEMPFLLKVFDSNGKELLSLETDFPYTSVSFTDNQVVLANRTEFCIYSLQGVEKYRGPLNAVAEDFFGIGNNRFVLITESAMEIMRLG